MWAPPAPSHHDRGIHIQHQPGQHPPGRPRRPKRRAGLRALRPSHLPGRRPGRRDQRQLPVVELVEQPPARRIRGHRPEQRRLIAQYRDVADALRAVGHRHRQIHQHPTRIMHRPPPPQRPQGLRQLPGQRAAIRQIRQQPRPGMRHHPGPIRRHGDLRAERGSLHLESASLRGETDLRQAQFPNPDRHFRSSTPRHADKIMKSRG